MGVGETVKGWYFSLEDRYYGFLDWLDSKGIPVYSVVDPIESAGIPSMPVMLILFLAVVFLIAWLLFGATLGGLFAGDGTVSVVVQDNQGTGIKNAVVSFQIGENSPVGFTTGEDGKIEKKFPLGTELKISVSKEGFESASRPLKVEQATQEAKFLLAASIQTLTKIVNLKTASGALYSKTVSIRFTCSGNLAFSRETIAQQGTATVQDIPLDCGTLIATPTSTGISFAEGMIDLSAPGTAFLSVSETTLETGTIKVNVKDEQGEPIAGANVKLMREKEGQFTQLTSTASGTTNFSDVPAGKYFIIVTHIDSKYADYDSSATIPKDIKELSPNAMIEFVAVLASVVKGHIQLGIMDAITRLPVANAKVTLIKGETEYGSASSDEAGSVDFAVSETGSIYSVRIDHPSYLIVTIPNLSASSSILAVSLQPASPDQATALEVLVLDGDDPNARPVENAKVQLKKSLEGEIASETLSTGLNGKAIFTRLAPGDYFAFVEKDGFEGITSPVVTVRERQFNQVTAILRIGSGTLSLLAMDDSQQPVSNASIQMMDAFSGAVLEEGRNGLDGKKSFTVRADKTVFFQIKATDFAQYNTVSFVAPVDSTREIAIQLVRDIVKLEAVLKGLYIGEESAGDSLTAGQRYTAKFLLMVPESVDWEEAGIHVRTGSFDEGKTNILESDYAYLGKVSSAANSVLAGKSFSPPNGFSEDSKHLTTGNSKWVNAVFSKNPKGVFEVQTEVQVIDSAPLSAILPLSYRAYGKSGGTITRSPVDAALGNSDTSSGKQGLYAKTNDRFFTIGPSTLCNDQFCYLFTIQDTRKDLKTMVIDEYPAKINSDYKLFFTLVNRSPVLLAGSELEISNEESGLLFGSYKITDAQGRNVSGNANSSQLTAIIGDLSQDSSIFGEIAFSTKKEGSNALNVSIQSNQQSAYNKTILVNVEPATQMKLDVLPKTIVPFLNNDLLVKVSDLNGTAGIAGAAVELSINGEVAASGTTNAEGIFQHTLQSPAPGWLVKITAQKNGYAMVSKEMKVSGNVLSIIPDSVNESLTVTGIFGFEKDFIVSNNTVVPATIVELAVSGELKKYLDIGTEENLKGIVIEPGKDTNFLLRVELTDAGKLLLEPTQLKGTLGLTATLAEKTWVNTIPFNVFIGFGGEVTDQNCLYLEPGNWTIFTASTQSQSQQIKITNKCRADQAYVSLKDVQVRLQPQGSDNVLGGFMVSSDLAGSRTIGLTNQFQSLAPQIAANADPALTISFTPAENVKTGQSTIQIIVQAMHTASGGLQPIVSTVTVNTSVNNLAECLQVLPTDLIVHSTPQGIGFDVYNSYGYGGNTYLGSPQQYGGRNSGFGRFDYTGNSNLYYNNALNGTQTIEGNPTLVDYPERLYATNYPYAQYSEPFYDSLAPVASNGAIPGYNGYRGASADYYGQQFGNFNYSGQFYGRNNQFRITNNCSAALDIALDPDPALLVNNNAFKLEPDKQQIIPIESTQYYGMYPLNVRAKLSGSKDNSQVIQTINVNVLPASDPTQFDNCIRLSTTKFKFNDFIQKPVIAKVYNSCYGQGVRIDYDSISFSNQGYGEQVAAREGSPGIIEAIEPVNLITSPGAMGSGSQILEFEVIKNINYRPQTVGSGSLGAGGQEGMVGFRTWATGAYNRVQARAQLVVRYSSPQGMEQRKMFRVMVEDFWNLFGSFPPMDWGGNQYISAKDCVIEDALDFGACVSDADFGGKNTYTSNSRQVLRIGPSPYRQNYPRQYYGMPNASSGTAYSGGAIANAPSNQYGTYQAPGGTPYSSGKQYNQLYQPTYAPTTYPQPYPYYAPNYSLPGQTTPYGIGGASLPPELLNVCGTTDKVTIKSQSFTKNGIKFTFSGGSDEKGKGDVTGNQKIKLSIDKSGATTQGETRLETKVEVEVFRQTPFGTSYVKLPAKVCVTIGKVPSDQNKVEPPEPDVASVPNATTPSAELCEVNYAPKMLSTGPRAYQQLFGKLLFNWNWDLGVKDDTAGDSCDSLYYCDAVQNTIGLVKKSKKIQGILDSTEIKTALNENKENVQATIGKAKLEEYQNTKNLMRWLTKQTWITDNAKFATGSYQPVETTDGEKLVFFFSKENPKELLELDPLEKSQKYQGMLTTFETAADTSAKLTAMTNILQNLSTDTKLLPLEIDSKWIVLTFDAKQFTTPQEKGQLADIGAESIEPKTAESKYALTLNEFGFLHQKIKECGAATECQIKNQKITVQFLSKLLTSNLKAIVAARHTADLTNPNAKPTEYEDTIKKFAERFEGTEEKANELDALVKSPANLVSDNYSESFKKDFAAYYSTRTQRKTDFEALVKNVPQWKFEPEAIEEPGQYEMMLNYSWGGNPKTEVSFKQVGSKKLTLLYSLPFDASLEQEINDNRNYGFSLAGNNSNRFLLQQISGETVPLLSDSTNTQEFQFLDGFSNSAEAKKGRILQWTKEKMVFSPSTPYSFSIAVPGTNNAVLYKFEEGSVSTKDIVWSKITEGLGTPNKVCQNKGGDTQYSLLQQNTKGLFFLPEKVPATVFTMVCSPQSATIEVKRTSPFSLDAGATETAKATKTSQGSVNIRSQKDPNKVMTLQSLAKAVRDGFVCVRADEESLEFAWNPEKIGGTG